MTPPPVSIRDRKLRRALRASPSVLSPLVLAAVIAAAPGSSRAEAPADVDFTKLRLEELMDVEVTSVSKRRQRVADAAAAIFVITQEDIRRSGATSVPELLRMAPGVEVARIDANKWAVSIRGFNGRFSEQAPRPHRRPQRLQPAVLRRVLGRPGRDAGGRRAHRGDPRSRARPSGAPTRSTASSTSSARAPRTPRARSSPGGAGTQERGFGAARFGGKAGEKVAYRGYVKSFAVDDSPVASGDRGADATQQVRTGFRIDADPTTRDLLTLSADLYKQDYGSTAVTQPLITSPFSTTFDDNATASGGNVLGRWTRQFSETSSASLQGYYDRFEKSEQGLGVTVDIADLDFQHEFEAFARNHVVWGLGYRYTRSSVDDSVFARVDPNHRIDNVFSAFVQDEIALIKDELRLTLGSKFEHNDTTGAEVQPIGPDPVVADADPVGLGVRLSRGPGAVARRGGRGAHRGGDSTVDDDARSHARSRSSAIPERAPRSCSPSRSATGRSRSTSSPSTSPPSTTSTTTSRARSPAPPSSRGRRSRASSFRSGPAKPRRRRRGASRPPPIGRCCRGGG